MSGFDNRIAGSLKTGVVIQLYVLSSVCILVAAMTGFGFFYISQISGMVVYLSLLLAVVCTIFCLNLFRMINAGGNFPVGFEQQNIESWNPSYISFFIITIVGALLTIPCAIYFHNSYLLTSTETIVGLVANWNAMVSQPWQAGMSIALFAIVFSSFYWLRYVFIKAVRQYEMLGWIYSRQLIDENQQIFSTFAQSMFYAQQEEKINAQKHFSDPPYNFKMKLFNRPMDEVLTFSIDNDQIQESMSEESVQELALNQSETQELKSSNGSHPDFFKKSARTILCGSTSSIKMKVANYLALDEFVVEQRILHSNLDENLESVFDFELRNQLLLKKYPVKPSLVQDFSAKPDLKQESTNTFSYALNCPNCADNLVASSTVTGLLYRCSNCASTLYSNEQMKVYFGENFDDSVFENQVYTLYRGPQIKQCNIGDSWLDHYTIFSPNLISQTSEAKLLSQDIDLFVCQKKQHYWLKDEQAMPLTKALKEHQKRKEHAEKEPLKVGYYLLQLLTAIPFEVYNPVRKLPMMLIGLIVLMSVIFVMQLQNLPIDSSPYLLYPSTFLEKPLTIISSMLMHANFQHLLGNMIFLWIFADNIEDKYGWRVLLSIFFFAGVCGSLLHIAINIESDIGLLGASGGVYGMMGAYFIFYKHVKVWWIIAFIRFKVSIILFVLFRVIMDVYGILFSNSNIAWFAHLGGFAAGIFIALVIKHRIINKLWLRYQLSGGKVKTFANKADV